MSSNFYNVYIGEQKVACRMPLQFALILVKGMYAEFYNEPELRITIERCSDAVMEAKAEENEKV